MDAAVAMATTLGSEDDEVANQYTSGALDAAGSVYDSVMPGLVSWDAVTSAEVTLTAVRAVVSASASRTDTPSTRAKYNGVPEARRPPALTERVLVSGADTPAPTMLGLVTVALAVTTCARGA